MVLSKYGLLNISARRMQPDKALCYHENNRLDYISVILV